jgi:hypothetical protein
VISAKEKFCNDGKCLGKRKLQRVNCTEFSVQVFVYVRGL